MCYDVRSCTFPIKLKLDNYKSSLHSDVDQLDVMNTTWQTECTRILFHFIILLSFDTERLYFWFMVRNHLQAQKDNH